MLESLQRCKQAARDLLTHLDFERFYREISIRIPLMASQNISLVLDVGANIGQFASRIRRQGYTGRIVSFEPLAKEFAQLQENAADDPGWECRHTALGSFNGTGEINRAGNSYSSSLLPMLERHIAHAPDSAYVGKEEISIARLDSLAEEIIRKDDRVYLKIDTQGYEMEVLKGSGNILGQVVLIELELTVVPLYENQVLHAEMAEHLNRLGYDLVWAEKGFSVPKTGEVLQFDGIFLRR